VDVDAGVLRRSLPIAEGGRGPVRRRVWAIGSQVNQTQNALLLHCDGGRWSTASSPAGSSALCAAITTPGGGRVWAFGTGTASQPPVVFGHA